MLCFIACPLQAADIGLEFQKELHQRSLELFGIKSPLQKSAVTPEGFQRHSGQPASEQVLLADGLTVEYFVRHAAHKTDQMIFWPNDEAPTHILTCVESGHEIINSQTGRLNPSVQRIEMKTLEIETILRGMKSCDGIRRTQWGTVLVAEETSDGRAYEIINPLATTEHTLLLGQRGSGIIRKPSGSASDSIILRDALPTMSWEGFTILPSGVVIGGDELRPGSYEDEQNNPDTDGGAIFKFIPDTPWISGFAQITDLSASPLAAGSVYAMQISCRGGRRQFGQGCEVGSGTWLPVHAENARPEANAKGATGFYRPEDLHRDPGFNDPNHPDAIRFCWANTGNEGAGNYAEIMCGIDIAPDQAIFDQQSVAINRFIEGDPDFNSMDNVAFQPGTGILYVIEDHPNGDIFACLPDGADNDIKSDGCVKILSVVDGSAEPTGFFFSADGKSAYLSIQHSADPESMDYDGYATDDILKITGFRSLKH